MIKQNIIALIHNTPLINLSGLTKGDYNLYAKQEYMQPSGSIKDRAALQTIQDAYKEKRLKKGQPVVEMTSGNMGAGLAVVCKQYGNPFTAVMSEGNSKERRKILKALGAEIVLTKQMDGTPGMVTGNDIKFAAEEAKKLAKKRNGYYVDQFNNQSSIRVHSQNTGPEIFADVSQIDAFVSCVGSGGTFLGVSKYLKSENQNIKCIAVEPESAAILKTGIVINPKHIIQGTGYGFVPPHWDSNLAYGIMTVSDEEVKAMTKTLSKDYGLYVGYSSGANVVASIKYANTNTKVKNVVTVLCDTGYKYNNN